MSIELLVQILGGLTGLGIAYAWYYLDERKHNRILGMLEAEHKIEMEKLRKQQLDAIRRQQRQ